MNKANIVQQIYELLVEKVDFEPLELKRLFLKYITSPGKLHNDIKKTERISKELTDCINGNDIDTRKLSTMELLKRLVDRNEESNSDDLVAYVNWKNIVGVK